VVPPASVRKNARSIFTPRSPILGGPEQQVKRAPWG
jgi:hypothetical protein